VTGFLLRFYIFRLAFWPAGPLRRRGGPGHPDPGFNYLDSAV
jgi:hypothetical protein